MWALFGVLLTAAGIVALVHPSDTFARFADILGFVFLLIGIMWMIQAFTERSFNDLWWLGLASGVLMVILGFWVSGQFFRRSSAPDPSVCARNRTVLRPQLGPGGALQGARSPA